MSVTLQAFAIIFAVGIFVILTIKGLGPIVGALIAGGIVALVAIGGFFSNMFGTFLTGMVNMFSGFFVLFTCGAAFGSLLAACGASDRLGVSLVKVMGERNFIYAIVIVSILFGLTGAPPLALVPPLCFGIFKKANLPRYIAMVAVTGSTSVSLSCIPGTLGASNVITATILGTSVYDGVLLGMVASIIGTILLCMYLNWLIKSARKKGLAYDPVEGNALMGAGIRSEDDMPGFLCAIVPVVVLLGGCAVFILGFGLESLPAVFFSTIIGIVLLLGLNRKYIHGSFLMVIRNGVDSIQRFLVGSIAVCGFAAVISNTGLYQAVIGAFLGSRISPYILVVVSVFIISALCADSIGGVAAFSATVGTSLVNSGVNAAIVHRLANITATVFDSVPHSGTIVLGFRSSATIISNVTSSLWSPTFSFHCRIQ
jgi:H+/gluconate symporter-like permease